MNIKTVAILIGVAFIIVGILGFFPNPIIDGSGNAIFHADTVHNIVHLVSGGLFILVVIAGTGITSGFMKAFGLIYLALGIMGMVQFGTEGMGTLLGFLHVNGPDNFLHIGLGLVIFLASFISPKAVPADSRIR